MLAKLLTRDPPDVGTHVGRLGPRNPQALAVQTKHLGAREMTRRLVRYATAAGGGAHASRRAATVRPASAGPSAPAPSPSRVFLEKTACSWNGIILRKAMLAARRGTARTGVALAVVVTLMVAVVMVMLPGAVRRGALLQVGSYDKKKASTLARIEYNSLADESAGIVAAALKGEGRPQGITHQSPLQSLIGLGGGGFSPDKPDSEVEEGEVAKQKRKKYAATMGDRYRELMGNKGPLPSCGEGPWWYKGCECVPSANVTCNATLDEVDHEYYGNARRPYGWHYQGPTAYPWKLTPLRRRLGYNRYAVCAQYMHTRKHEHAPTQAPTQAPTHALQRERLQTPAARPTAEGHTRRLFPLTWPFAGLRHSARAASIASTIRIDRCTGSTRPQASTTPPASTTPTTTRCLLRRSGSTLKSALLPTAGFRG